jgi:C1A family cysteine protease
LKFGVVAVSINAQLGLQFYANGTYNPATGVPNHGVTLVGYDPIN